MGAWGPGIFDDDIALDVRDFVDDQVAGGKSMADATRSAVIEFNEIIEDAEDLDDSSIVWLALAATQLDHGEVELEIGQRALSIISGGADLERWQETGSEMLGERRRVLQELRSRLLAAIGGT